VGFLGAAHVEGEQADQAIPLLTTATEQMRRFGFLQLRAWFQAWLTDAYRLSDKLEAAASTAAEAVQAATQARFQFGLGLSHRALARVIQAQGVLAEAEAQFQTAHTHFSEVNARFEVARTRLDLSLLAHVQGRRLEAREHLTDAHSRFLELRVPRYAARAEALAPTLGVTL
jgi:hypothetical protein